MGISGDLIENARQRFVQGIIFRSGRTALGNDVDIPGAVDLVLVQAIVFTNQPFEAVALDGGADFAGNGNPKPGARRYSGSENRNKMSSNNFISRRCQVQVLRASGKAVLFFKRVFFQIVSISV